MKGNWWKEGRYEGRYTGSVVCAKCGQWARITAFDFINYILGRDKALVVERCPNCGYNGEEKTEKETKD